MDAITWVHRCLIVPASVVGQARAAAAALAPAGAGMWNTGLSATGAAPATHYISTGLIDKVFADLLANPTPDLAALVAVSDVSEEQPFVAMQRMGLTILNADT